MRLPKKLAILFLAQFIICTGMLCASAQETQRKWTSYAKDYHEVEYFYDKDAVTRVSKYVIQVWRKRVFPAKSPQKEIVALDEINCRLQKYRSLELYVTAWDGSTKISKRPGVWATIWAKSAEEYHLDTDCKELAGKPFQEQEKAPSKD
jgi:hypothetical protein